MSRRVVAVDPVLGIIEEEPGPENVLSDFFDPAEIDQLEPEALQGIEAEAKDRLLNIYTNDQITLLEADALFRLLRALGESEQQINALCNQALRDHVQTFKRLPPVIFNAA